jgi:hypothetical protein
LATYSGRTAQNEPRIGEIERHQVVLFVKQCRDEGWRRVAVYELNFGTLAASNENGYWLHPQLWGMN